VSFNSYLVIHILPILGIDKYISILIYKQCKYRIALIFDRISFFNEELLNDDKR
jgi:hypothetical protein